MDIQASIFSLAKNNNGFFKSEKQAAFLKSVMDQRGGNIGHVTSGYNSCPVFAEYDDKGITKIIKACKGRNEVMFERKVEGVRTQAEEKEIRFYKRELKKLEREYATNKEAFETGIYDGSNDPSSYTPDTIALYNKSQDRRKERILDLKSKLSNISGH